MVARQHLKTIAGIQGEDLSGHDFLNSYAAGQNFFESTFNGCSFDNTHASQSIFQHAEFTETRFSECVFEDTSFDHSDFVMASLFDTQFIRCTFQNAEWRDTVFDTVRFQQCIFRNTTTSLTLFRNCSFDLASAASFIGPSKRFSVFSNTTFHLPSSQVSFLLTNYGISAPEATSSTADENIDPLFRLSLLRYSGRLTSSHFYRSALDALLLMTSGLPRANRLKMSYLASICNSSLEENRLSVFTIKLLESAFSDIASRVIDRDQALQLFSLILNLRLALRQQIADISTDIAIMPAVPSKMRLKMHFENEYHKAELQDYLQQMANYCGISSDLVVLENVQRGSTIAEAIVAAPILVTEVVRFIRYSLSLATVTVLQGAKLRKAFTSLTGAGTARKRIATPKTGGRSRTLRGSKKAGQSMGAITSEMVGIKSDEAKQIEIFVDKAKDRILVVDGRVRVSISLI
jgi:uncharacterized protein YjbI with pentapeptide repeats